MPTDSAARLIDEPFRIPDFTQDSATLAALRESRAKSAVLSRISHELRTPLNAVLGLSQLLLADERSEDAASAARRRRVEHIHAAGKRLLVMVDDMLQLSGVDGAGAAPATHGNDPASELHAATRQRGSAARSCK